MIACANCGEENPERARFCLGCGSSLAPAEAPREERRIVTALFTDIVGSTASAEQLDPEDVRARLAPYYARVRAELEQFGGSVEKFIGDAVVALFGAPVAHEDDPERAVRAALAVRSAIEQLNAEDAWLDLNIRTGVNTGEALVVLGAPSGEGIGMAAGDIMNTAARIQSAAPVNGILVGARTYDATKHAIEYSDGEPIAAKGKAEPVQVWEALAAREAPARRRRVHAPLVGRIAELARLESLWQSVRRDRRALLAALLGAPGIGKSRLIEEFVERADATVFTGRCLPYGEGITYWPVVEIVKDAADIRHDDDEETDAEKLDRFLRNLPTEDPTDLRTIASALANLLGIATTPQGTYSATDLTQAELHWGLRRLFELLAREPLLIVLEDLHWAEPTLLELIQGLASVDAPVLVLASARPELEDRSALLAPAERRHVLKLDALDEHESEALALRLFTKADLPPGALESLLRNAGGNPLFVEETVQMVLDSGLLEDGWDTHGETLPVPSNLQALIASRLDQLGSSERRVAQNASVVGTVFWPGAVAHLNGVPGELNDLLDSLERRDVIRGHESSAVTEEREFAFKHILIRDVAYGQLPKGRRAALHVRCSEWIGNLAGGEDEFVEIIAYHLEQACRLAREVARSPVPAPIGEAVAVLSRSARKAERREGIREAARYYERALQLLGEGDIGIALDLHAGRGRTLAALGDLRSACAELLFVLERAEEFGRNDLRCEALIGLANIDRKQGRPTDAQHRLEEAGELAALIGADELRTRARYETASLRAWAQGEFESAIDELLEALETAEALDDHGLRVEGHMRMGTLLFNAGRLAEADEQLENAVRLAGELGSFRDEARATTLLGFVRYYRRPTDEAEGLALQALEWLERTCDGYLQLQNMRALGKYALARGDAHLAEERLRGALPLALESGGWLLLEIYRYLAEALVAQDRLDDAAEMVSFAARNLPEQDLVARAALLLAEASVATAHNERESATAAFEEALRLLEEQRLTTDLGEARLAFGRALREFGETVGAQTEFERARSMFRRMEAESLVTEVDRELEMAAGPGVAGPAAGS